jgi:hypothetical protein
MEVFGMGGNRSREIALEYGGEWHTIVTDGQNQVLCIRDSEGQGRL